MDQDKESFNSEEIVPFSDLKPQSKPFDLSPKTTNQSNTSCLQKCLYNIKYSLLNSDSPYLPQLLKRKTIKLAQGQEPAYLFGQVFYANMNKQFLSVYKNIIWFTYKHDTKTGRSDAGWGCMIRAAQMLLSHILTVHNTEEIEKQTVNQKDILQLFLQGQNHKFSIQNICKEGHIKERWTGCNEIMSVVISMLEKQKQESKNQQFKEIFTSVYSTINPKKTLKQLNPMIYEEKSRKKPKKPSLNLNIVPHLYYSEVKFHEFQKLQESDFPQMIIISNKVSRQQSTLPQQYFNHIKHLMKLSNFCGIIGGISHQALYIVGFHDDQAIILDPHFIKEQSSEKSQSGGINQNQYHLDTPKGISLSSLSSSLSISFYVRSIEQYKTWVSEISYLDRIYRDSTVFNVNKQQCGEDEIQRFRKRSQDFEVLCEDL